MTVESRTVRNFLVVAEELHVTRAAERLHLSQPALSRQIAELERQVGVPLLIRGTRSVTLTEAGQTLARGAARALADLDRTVEQTRTVARGELGHLSIGFIGSAVESIVTPALRAVRTEIPGLTFTSTERPWVEQTAGLEAGIDDVAFVRDLTETGRWRVHRLLSEPVCLVLPSHHTLAPRRSLEVTELDSLRDAPFISTPSWIALRCGGWPFQPKVADEVVSTHGILSLVAAGVGVSLVPSSYRSWASEAVRFVPVEGQITTQQIAWREGSSSAVRDRFLATVKRSLSAPS